MNHPVRTLLCIIFFPLLISFTSISQAQNSNEEEITIENWLLLGPVDTKLPLWHDTPNVRNQTYSITNLLDHEPADQSKWTPAAGERVRWSGDRSLQWRAQSGEEAPLFTGTAGETAPSSPMYGWAAFYLENNRFTKATVIIRSHHPFVIYVNGEQKGTKSGSEDADADAGSHSAEVRMLQGKHSVLVRSLYNPENDAPWNVKAFVKSDNGANIKPSITPQRFLDLETISNQPQLGSLAISADGSLAAMRINMPAPPDGQGDSWLEIWETSNGNLNREFRGGKDFGSLTWAPEAKKFTYTESEGGKTSLWLADLESGSQQRLLHDVEHFAGYRWSPDGTFILYSVSERPEANTTGVRLIDDLEERRPWHFNRSFIYKLNVPEGTTRRLTAGQLTTSLHDISPDGKKALISRSSTDYSQRPYSVTEYRVLTIETLETDSLFTVPFGGSGSFSPDGRSLLFTGGPSMFGDLGTNVPEGMVANDYDTQAYLYDISSRNVKPVTLEFDPAINQAIWGADSNTIYFITTDRSYRNLYRYDVRRDRFTKIETVPDVINQVDIARNGRTAIYSGTGISQPVAAWTLDLRRDRSSQLRNPGDEFFSQVQFGRDKVWSFTTEEGREIEGYVYYPPDFDPDKKYPVISYYYGGTVPVSRDFGGRYPKELYAAKGYIVYVMQPSGATGFGQEFSALHVNDWGIIVADEIIEGVGKFLDEHPYADRERVGAIGASYGGFMTMLLLTRTDIFAAGVSHAGISNIASYWGEGFWGFQYSAIATANSFPWNREDIYIGQSPLYSADRVTTPLLFVTGMSDTNVPPGESLQMYTALKLLERETAFVAVDDQDHHIVDYAKYKLWKESILAWFDKFLKDEPEWWEEKYGQ
jgi:dipeptidyl aminopeptidase/acylaminoacyl peptidase